MSGSAKEIYEYIDQWDLAVLQKKADTIENGFIMKALKLSNYKCITASQLLIEDHLGSAVDKNKYKNNCQKLLTHLTQAKNSTKSKIIWAAFTKLLNTQWTVPPPCHRESKRRLETLITEPISKKLRSDCGQCPVLQARLEALQLEHDDQVSVLKNQIFDLQRSLYEEKEEKQMWRRKVQKRQETLDNLRKERKYLKARLSRRENRAAAFLSRLLKNEKIRSTMRKKSVDQKVQALNKEKEEKKELKSELLELKRYVEDLECSAASKDVLVFDEERPRQYHWKVRRLVYHCISAKVPFANASELLNQTTNHKICQQDEMPVVKMPSGPTCARMIWELSVICLLQATTALVSTQNATLCWDATYIDDQHVNEIHIQTTEGTFTVSLRELPGGKAMDYVAHMMSVINQMARLFSDFTGQDIVLVKNKIISRITSTMSDRASANHAAVETLQRIWGTDLAELNCNVHPLDTFQSEIKAELKKLDDSQEVRRNTGRECSVANMFKTFASLRLKQTGDPRGFSTFLKKNGISPAEIMRYVGNKWNLVFLMSHTVIKHKKVLQEYLEKFCKKEAMRDDLLWAITNSRIIGQLKALTLIGQMITVPYQTLFYSNKLGMSNLEFVPHIQTFSENIKRASRDLDFLLESRYDIFGDELKRDDLRLSLQGTTLDGSFRETLQLAVDVIDRVSSRQLQRYITGDLSEVTQEMLDKTSSSTPHNVWAERCLGAYDAYHNRLKQAKTKHLEVKCQLATNKTLDWLQSQPDAQQEEIIKFAIKAAGPMRKSEKERQQWLRNEEEKRLVLASQARDLKSRRELEKKIVEVFKKGDVNGLLQFDGFVGLNEDVKSMVIRMFEKKNMKEVGFVHSYDEEDGSNSRLEWTCCQGVPSQASKLSLVTYYLKY